MSSADLDPLTLTPSQIHESPKDDTHVSPFAGYEPSSQTFDRDSNTINNLFNGTALAESPEHPDFAIPWSNDAATLGFGQHDGSESTQQDLTSFNQYIPSNMTAMPMTHSLSHASSISSLASLNSNLSDSHMGSTGSFMLDSFSGPFGTNPLDSHSRHSSLTTEEKNTFMPMSHESDVNDTINMWTMPTSRPDIGPTDNLSHSNLSQLYTVPDQSMRGTPKLQVQTQGLCGRISGNRTRSSSRVQPYHRERSESVSVKSEADEDITALYSSATSHSAYPSPWTGNSNALIGGMGKITLHHRRTSSNLSQNRSSPARPSLTRAHRSSSLAISRKPSGDLLNGKKPKTGHASDEVDLSGSAAQREAAVQKDLMEKADNVRSITSTTQQDKARALWVRRWLQLSYEHSIGFTVPRQALYHSYSISCQEYGMRPINSASFGKAMRNAYPGIKTRRLGNRGNSKYHYVSLRPAIPAEAHRLNEYGDSSGQWHIAPDDGEMRYQNGGDLEEMDSEDYDDEDVEDDDEVFGYPVRKSPSSMDLRSESTRPLNFARRHTTATIISTPFNQSSVNDASPVWTLPSFPNMDDLVPMLGQDARTAQALWSRFCQHADSLCSHTRSMRFDLFEMSCRQFWAGLTPQERMACQNPEISNKIDAGLAVTYDSVLGIALTKLLGPLSSQVQTSLKNLAVNLETVMSQALSSFDTEFSEPKVELSVRAGHLLLRFADIHQLTTALTPILSNQDQVRSMARSWETLDARSLSDQCALSCNCQPDLLETVLAGFQYWLLETESSPSRGGRSIERLGGFVESILKEVTERHGRGAPPNRALIPRAGFITSQIMRDFTLKSDPCFGLFQLIKTWIDDYVSLLVLRQIALSPTSLDTPHFVPEMSVIIPPISDNSSFYTHRPDLTTAVPQYQSKGNSQGTFLQMPFMLGGSGGGSTPRPTFN